MTQPEERTATALESLVEMLAQRWAGQDTQQESQALTAARAERDVARAEVASLQDRVAELKRDRDAAVEIADQLAGSPPSPDTNDLRSP